MFYHQPLGEGAQTITDHVESFGRYSKFNVWKINTFYGFPSGLLDLEFSLLVFHYSLFGAHPFALPKRLLRYIDDSKSSARIAYFQDEYRYCDSRFNLINRLRLGVIYTLLESQYFKPVYYERTKVQNVLPTLAGYVPEGIESSLSKFGKPFTDRTIDVGYRARQLPYHFGKGAQEKSEISVSFVNKTSNQELHLDISNEESDRLYGDDWYQFIGNCKFMLGVEAGVSIFDFDGEIAKACSKIVERNPAIIFDDVYKKILIKHEGNVNYRMISPRIFEAAALQTIPLLFKGEYTGIILPDKNYIMIEKDFSNISEVLKKMMDEGFCKEIIANNLELISRFELTYRGFIRAFDEDMHKIFGITCATSDLTDRCSVDKLLNRGFIMRRMLVHVRHGNFPGRKSIAFIYHKARSLLKKHLLF